jgi:hypothetical protein
MPIVVFGSLRGSPAAPRDLAERGLGTKLVMDHLAGLGYRRTARVSGIARYWHTKLRSEAIQRVALAAGH